MRITVSAQLDLSMRSTLEGILRTGFSRLPIYRGSDRQRIRGYLLVKSLAVVRAVL